MYRFFVQSVLLISTGLLTGSNAGVVCLGVDGHVAFESPRHSHCEHDGHEEHVPAALPQLCGLSCQPCMDIPLETGPAVSTQKTAPIDAEMRLPAAPAADPRPTLAKEADHCGPSYFSPLKSIILLN